MIGENAEEIEYIKSRITKDPEMNFFAFFENEDDREIRIYFILESGEPMFFRIRKGIPLPAHEEEILLMILLNEEVKILPDLLAELCLIQCFIAWNILIKRGDFKHKLLRLYFASYDNPLEKIAKTDLHYIFYALIDGRIVDTQKHGKSVEEILGVKIRLLRAMDSPEGIEFLRTPDQRMQISKVYTRYHGLITNAKLSTLQIKYLLNHYGDGEKITLQKLESLNDYSTKEMELMNEYNLKRQSVLEYYPNLPLFVPRSKLEYFHTLAVSIASLAENESYLNEVLANRLKNISFEGDYVILSTLRAFTRTASTYSNCLYQYPWKVGFNDSDIVVILLPKAGVCMELRQVKDTYIFIQALSKNNKEPNEKQTQELLRFLNQNKQIKII